LSRKQQAAARAAAPVILLNSCLGEGDESCKSRCIMRFSCGLGRRGICREGGRGAGEDRTGQDSASRATCQWVSAARLCLPAFPTAIICHPPNPQPTASSLHPPPQLTRQTHLTPSRGRHPSDWPLPGLRRRPAELLLLRTSPLRARAGDSNFHSTAPDPLSLPRSRRRSSPRRKRVT